MQTNIILVPLNGKSLSRIGIQLHYLPFEWSGSKKGELKTVLLDTFLEIDPKNWDFQIQRPFREFSTENKGFIHFMIDVQIKRAREVFKELCGLMIEGRLCGYHIEALYMERNHDSLIPFLKDLNWKIILS